MATVRTIRAPYSCVEATLGLFPADTLKWRLTFYAEATTFRTLEGLR